MIWAILLLAAPIGVVEGTVTDAASKLPVSGATVRLYRGDNVLHTGTTDAGGQFRIGGVQEGEYRPAILSPDHMLPAADHPAAQRFHITAARPTVSLNAELLPRAQVAGRVLSPTGEPMKGVPVAMRKIWYEQFNHTTISDERGAFRFGRLEPGTWILAAVPGFRISLQDPTKTPKPIGPPDAEDGQRLGWATTFFPGVADLAGAEKVVLRPGSRLEGCDIRLRNAPVRRLSGVVLDEAGRPVPKASVSLSDVANRGANAATTTADARGRFDFEAVQDGDWRVFAQGGAPGQTLKGFLDIRVARRDLTGVEIRIAVPFPLKGVVDREEPRDGEGKRKVTAVYLMPEDTSSQLRESTFHEQDGTFVLKNVYAGRYRVLPAGFVPGYYVASIWYGDQDVTTRAIDVSSPPLPLKIVYKAGAARASGTVERGEGSTVVLVPEDESLRDSDQFIRSAKCGPDGRFSIDSLRPGSYHVFAFDRVEREMLEDVQFVRKLVTQAVRIEVRGGENASIELRPQTWPDY